VNYNSNNNNNRSSSFVVVVVGVIAVVIVQVIGDVLEPGGVQSSGALSPSSGVG